MLIQNFFFLGGFLLTVQFAKKVQNNPKVGDLPFAFLYRLGR
jgi:hypothetical protein